MGEIGVYFNCNERAVVLSKEQVGPHIRTTESRDASCPPGRRMNLIEGFTEISAFRCLFCGEGVQ
jgi:hypothetical protein